MGLEATINTIADLNVTWPTDGDVASQGDNHLRLIKDAVKKTFPNVSAVVTSDASELNTLDGINTANNFGMVPSKGIIMWSGSIATIPAGWFLCDGTNGTPNLRDRFIVGAGTTYAVGAMGGAATVALVEANLPSHTHTVSGTTGGQSADHTHTGYTDFQGAHAHNLVIVASGASDGTPSANAFVTDTNGAPVAMNGNQYTTTAGSHQHAVQTYGASNGHTHTFSGTTSAIGSGSAHDNLPPYLALAYIMKA